MKFWRESHPARVAITTAGLLALILLTMAGAGYAATGIMLRAGVDSALQAALPATGTNFDPDRWEDDDDDHHEDRRGIRVRVIPPQSAESFNRAFPQPDAATVELAMHEGLAYASLTLEDFGWQRRTGPEWWQALTPDIHEVRVLYARTEIDHAPAVLQLVAPMSVPARAMPGLRAILLLLAAGGTAVCGVVAWRMAAASYRPLQAITATADDISTRTLSVRIPDVWPDRTLRRLVRVLNAMFQRLQSAFDAQGRFVAAAAHELRGPLAAMRTHLEVALRREREPAEYRAALETALTETVRLTALSEHLLVLARYERGAGLAMERDLPLRPLLERAAAEVMRSAGGQVEVQAPPDLTLDGDPIALERMVANLVRNGVQAGGSPVLLTAASTPDGAVEITVQDHGRGIPLESQPFIFEPFYRSDPARGRDGGAGLGLTIVRTVVEAHGGQISLQSAPGQGARFVVRLPRQPLN